MGMRWYVNDFSLQGQFTKIDCFERLIRGLLSLRARFEVARNGLYTTRALRERLVSFDRSVAEVVRRSVDADFRRAVLSWLDRNGPFTEDDRLTDPDDYFEYAGQDITETGLGEAARRIKASVRAMTFSFVGATPRFELTSLVVDHGLDGDRLGSYPVENAWTLKDFEDSVINSEPSPTSWKELIESLRRRFPLLVLPDNLYLDDRLAREPFDAGIRDRVVALCGYLNAYISDRRPDGSDGESARSIVANFFTGDRALFSGESPSNQATFKQALTFRDPIDSSKTIFAHWHGKIGHRFFRMHIEWPVPTGGKRVKVLYLGPKLTKS
jgi:hypothetical protein